MFVHLSMSMYKSPSCIYLGKDLLGCREYEWSVYKTIPNCFQRRLYKFTFPSAVDKEMLTPHFLQNLVLSDLLFAITCHLSTVFHFRVH